MTRNVFLVALLGLMLASVPLALAQDEPTKNQTEERPDDAAWVEDCPPDMMCAMAAPAENETHDEPTYNGECGGEICAYEAEPATSVEEPAQNEVPGLPIATALGILALAALGVALLRR